MGLFGFGKKVQNPASGIMRGHMNLNRYEVIGTNPATGRTKKSTVQALTAASAKEVSGLTNATVVELGWDAPTEQQIAYCKKIGIRVPADAVKEDVSALLSTSEDGDDGPASKHLIDLAAKDGIALSYLTGKTRYKSTIKCAMEDKK